MRTRFDENQIAMRVVSGAVSLVAILKGKGRNGFGYGSTASYAQVTEKLYDRSRFRYRHYRAHLEPVIPILRPIIERLGYTIE